jgi:hypothetical protein
MATLAALSYAHVKCMVTSLCLILCLSAAHSVPDEKMPPDALALLLLQQENFQTLEERFAQYHLAHDAERLEESVLELAYDAFTSVDPDLAPKFQAWIEAYPQSFSARLARAFYHWELGWIARGTKPRADTHAQQFAGMEAYFRLALVDLEAALQRKSDLGLVYALHINNIAMASWQGAPVEQVLRHRLKAAPKSVKIRRRYLQSLQPWWFRYEVPAWSDYVPTWLQRLLLRETYCARPRSRS